MEIVCLSAGLIAGIVTGLVAKSRAMHWCQDCGGALPLRHRAGEGCRVDRSAEIIAYARGQAARPGVKP
ncbi:hypothetical protein Cme02nite_37220 [Catellatospora methionotrophica]|uniref:Uncharacterized protein n=1 Tax=Catellatospora methionotrophica TaxID=121620 RepID=A0A8J3LMJ6_9ACTN|nr:hypothetical protein Cme02nite_37220 [Catellatospora methionotrophica]